MSAPLTSYTQYIRNFATAYRAVITCVRCGVAMTETQKRAARMWTNEDATFAYWRCAECEAARRAEMDEARY